MSSPPPVPAPTIPPRNGLENFCETLRRGGLDLQQPFSVEAVRASLPESLLPHVSRLTSPLGLVIGNTHALWPAFRSHLIGLGVRNARELGPDPLDIYVEELIHSALDELASQHQVEAQVLFGHDENDGKPVPIQRICDLSGLARLSPSHLTIHPLFGPWMALRAVVSFDLPLEFGVALDWKEAAPSPCQDCSAPCRKALANAMLERDQPAATAPRPPAGLSKRKARWLAVREVCPVGRSARYSDDQIRYHYDKDRSALLP